LVVGRAGVFFLPNDIDGLYEEGLGVLASGILITFWLIFFIRAGARLGR